MTPLDAAVRQGVYRGFADASVPPTRAALAAALGESLAEIDAALQRLAAAHALVLDPGTREVWMALPFSAVPTPHVVRAGGRSWFANCAWDLLGIPVALGLDAELETSCADCGERRAFTVQGGELHGDDAVVHFAVPRALWWKDIGFT